MLTYQLLTGAFPYMDDVNTAKLQTVWKNILSMQLDLTRNNSQVAHLSDLALDFLTKTLDTNVQERASAYDLLQHPWLR